MMNFNVNTQMTKIQSVFLKGGCLVVNGYDGGDVAWVNSSLSRATVVTKVSRSLLHLHPHALVRLMMMMVDKIWWFCLRPLHSVMGRAHISLQFIAGPNWKTFSRESNMLHLSRARLHERVQSGEMIESINKKPQTHKILAPTAFEDSLKKLKTTLGKLLRLKI